MSTFLKPTLLLAGLGLTSPGLVAQAPAGPQAHWVDFDGDGLMDLFVSNPAGDRLFRALPGGGHEDVTVASGFDGSEGSRAALWGDFDGDGDADLLRLAEQWRLLLNEDGQLSDATERVGLAHEGLDFDASWRDVDGDGRQELEVLQRDRVLLFHPLAGGAFERVELPLPSPFAAGVGPEVLSGEPSDDAADEALDLGRAAERSGRDRAYRGGGRTEAPLPGRGLDPTGDGGSLDASAGVSTSSVQGPMASVMGGVCAVAVEDEVSGACLPASTEPEVGALYPLGSQLWVGSESLVGNRAFDFQLVSGGPFLPAKLHLYGGSFEDPTAFGPHWVVDRTSGDTTINADTTVNGAMLVQTDDGDTELMIVADPDNTHDGWQPRLSLTQDGGNVVGSLGFVNGQNNLALANEFGESKIMIDADKDVRIVDTESGVSGFQFNVVDGGNELLVQDGLGQTFANLDAVSAEGGGRFRLWDDGSNPSFDQAAVTLDTKSNGGAGRFQLWDPLVLSAPAVEMRARAAGNSGSELTMRSRDGWETFKVDNVGYTDSQQGMVGEGGRLRLWEGTEQVALGGPPAVSLIAKSEETGSEFRMRNDADVVSFFVDSELGPGGGALLQMSNYTDVMNFEVTSNWNGSGAARAHLRNGANKETVVLNGEIGALGLNDAGEHQTVVLNGDDGSMTLKNTSDEVRFQVVTHWNGTDSARAKLCNDEGEDTIILNGEIGRAQVKSIIITGGSDLAEPFQVSGEAVEPGTLVCIDPERLGQLVVASEAYDPKVAGVISGAGGINPGLTLSQEGTIADGAHPVAMTGRVWCKADASFGAIRPGDLLTTSTRPGHAMRVSDPDKSLGAVIGKAMSALDDGTGLVLVLVNLQ